MTNINASSTFWPLDAFGIVARLTSHLEALSKGRRFALSIKQLRNLDPHLLKDIGVNEGALYELEPKIIDSDGRIVFS